MMMNNVSKDHWCYQRLLLRRGVVAVISGELLLPGVGHGVAVLTAHAGDVANNILRGDQIQIKTLN